MLAARGGNEADASKRLSSEPETIRTALTSIAEQAETSGVSYFAQIPGRQRRKLMAIRYAIPKRSIFNSN
jgi:flagellin-like hook-associated protein FlgL